MSAWIVNARLSKEQLPITTKFQHGLHDIFFTDQILKIQGVKIRRARTAFREILIIYLEKIYLTRLVKPVNIFH